MQQSDESAAIRGPHVRPWYATDNRLLSILCHPIGVLLFWCALSYCRNLGPKKNRGPRFFLFLVAVSWRPLSFQSKRAMSPIGTSRHFAAPQNSVAIRGIADIPTHRLIGRNPRIAMKATTERCLGTAAAKMDRCPPKLESFYQWRCLNPNRIKGCLD